MSSNLDISEVEIICIKPRNGLVGFCSFVINKSVYIGDVAIHVCLSNSDGYRLVYPERVLANGKRVNAVHPINREAGEAIQKAVISEYKKLTPKGFKNERGEI